MGREGCASSSLLLFPSGLDFGKLSAAFDTELTHMPPHCRPPAQTECVALRRPLEIFSEMMEDSGTNVVPAGKKNKVPSEVTKHTVSLSCSVVKLVYSISLANIPKTGTATVDPLSVDEDRTT